MARLFSALVAAPELLTLELRQLVAEHGVLVHEFATLTNARPVEHRAFVKKLQRHLKSLHLTTKRSHAHH